MVYDLLWSLGFYLNHLKRKLLLFIMHEKFSILFQASKRLLQDLFHVFLKLIFFFFFLKTVDCMFWLIGQFLKGVVRKYLLSCREQRGAFCPGLKDRSNYLSQVAEIT